MPHKLGGMPHGRRLGRPNARINVSAKHIFVSTCAGYDFVLCGLRCVRLSLRFIFFGFVRKRALSFSVLLVYNIFGENGKLGCKCLFQTLWDECTCVLRLVVAQVLHDSGVLSSAKCVVIVPLPHPPTPHPLFLARSCLKGMCWPRTLLTFPSCPPSPPCDAYTCMRSRVVPPPAVAAVSAEHSRLSPASMFCS